MEPRVPVEAKVVDVMAISSVLDQFDSFNQNLKELTIKYNVKKAPTLLVPDGDHYLRFENASDINRYVEGLKKRA